MNKESSSAEHEDGLLSSCPAKQGQTNRQSHRPQAFLLAENIKRSKHARTRGEYVIIMHEVWEWRFLWLVGDITHHD